ncbi:MAG: DUF4143 domain-containing protein [Chloroflexota bacterium]|nr:DUF4143 domain-containing protein [Chloroflexota bacterium]
MSAAPLSSAYLRRLVDNELDELSGLPAVVLEGAKGVGKTETARRRARTIHRLDRPDEQALVEADPDRLVRGTPPILIDEWQRYPASWDLVRRAVDDDPRPGRFLLTGSIIPDDQSAPVHSGAGRIVTVRMRPLSLAERGVGVPTVSLRELLGGSRPTIAGTTSVGLSDYTDEMLASGFPGLRRLGPRALRAALDGYIDRIVTHDFPEMGVRVRQPALLRRWMEAYAAAVSSTATIETLRDAAALERGKGPSKPTAFGYVNLLERLWIIEHIPAWLPSRNRLQRLAETPKRQLLDTAIAARLLGLGADALLAGGPDDAIAPRDGTYLGSLFESFVTGSVLCYAQSAEARVRHLRLRAPVQREVDLIVERADARIVAIEVKLRRVIRDGDVRHLLWLQERIGSDLLDAVIVTTGGEAYRRQDGIAVVPAALLGP